MVERDRRGNDLRARHTRSIMLLRAGTLLSLLLMAGAAILPRAVGAESPYSTISPRTEVASDIQFLYKLIFWMALVVFVGVQAGLVYTVLRFRRRSEQEERPEQVHGNKTLEIAWTILPAIVLLVIFIPTVQTLFKFDAEAQEADADYVIDVYGKQWWWEVHYAEPSDQVGGIITANEIYIPAGKRVVFRLYSNNVIHSFWVPQLSGKMDLIPGHVNRLGFTADKPGVYYGECAEFCGDSHAWMRFIVHVQPQEQFDAWVNAWKAGPSQAAADAGGTGDVARAPDAFAVCAACHRINGTQFNAAAVGLEQTPDISKIAGPNLTLFGCRATIGAGLLRNTPENLASWLRDPGAIKPGNHMATAIKPGVLTEDQIQTLVNYLQALRPAEGCPPPVGENADMEPPTGDDVTIPPAQPAEGAASEGE